MALNKGKQIAGDSKSGPSKRKKAVTAGPARRKRRSGVLQFFDESADVDDDLSSENDDGDDLDWDVEEPDYGFSNNGKCETKDAKGGGKGRHVPFFIKEEDMDDDDLEELIKERYSNVAYKEDAEECKGNTASLPEFIDTHIWRAKCMVGRERQMAFCFMQKYLDLHRLGTKLNIISVFAIDHVKGYVFFEADKLSDIHEACRGFIGVYASRIDLVPSTELTHLFVNREKFSGASVGTWVRMKSGNYKGDLAQVVHIDKKRNRATVKLIPRVDMNSIAKKFGGGVSLKLAPVPAPRLITPCELEPFRPHIEVRRDRETGEVFEVLDGLMLKDGFLYKKMSLQSLIFSCAQPSSDELLKFSSVAKEVNEDLTWVSSVYNGRKKVRLEEPSNGEESTSGKNGYTIHDLVLFGKKDFGVIISEEKDCYRILKGETEGAQVVSVRFQDVKSSFIDKMLSALDRHKKTISISSTVKVTAGPLEGRQGTVKHMYKGTLFIHDENEQENGGLLSVRSTSCEREGGPNKSYSQHSAKDQYPSFSQTATASDEPQEFINARPQRRYDNENSFSVGQTLRIKAGPLKGYLCRVISIRRSNITVKLDSLVKIITVEEKFLTDPCKRRENLTADIGNAETLFTGGLSWGDAGVQEDKSAWDAGPSTGRDCQLPLDGNNERQTDQERDDDPWSSRALKSSDDSGQALDGWSTKRSEVPANDPWSSNGASAMGEDAGPSKGSDGWSKSADKGHDADPWSSKSATVATNQATDAWNTKCSEVPAKDPWSSNGASAMAVAGPSKGLDDWSKTADKGDPWSAKSATVATNQATDAWNMNRSEVPASDPWSSNGASAMGEDAGPSKGSGGWGITADKGHEADPWSAKPGNNHLSDWTSPDIGGNEKVDLSDKKGKAKINEESTWGRVENIQELSTDDTWSKLATNAASLPSTWAGSNNTSGGQSDSWARPQVKKDDESSGWKAVNEPKEPATNNQDSWGKPVQSQWGKDSGFGAGEANAGDGGNKTHESSWNQQKNISKQASWSNNSSGWNNSSQNADVTAGWNNSSQNAEVTAGPSGNSSSWDKDLAPATKVGTGWDLDATTIKVNSGSSSWKVETDVSGGEANPNASFKKSADSWVNSNNDTWNKPMDQGVGHTSSWGSPGEQNGESGGIQTGSWNSSRAFEGGGSSNWERGRGRYGGRGGRSYGGRSGENGDQDGNTSSGRGRGRGRFNSYNRQNDQDNSSGGNYQSSWGRSGDQDGNTSDRGRGRGGRFNSFDRESDQDNSGGGVSNSASSSWGSDQNTGGGNKNGNRSCWGGNEDQNGNVSSGRGRGGGRGRFNSFNRQNDQENSADDKSNTSTWGNDQNTSWGNKSGNSWKQEQGDTDNKGTRDGSHGGNYTSSWGGSGYQDGNGSGRGRGRGRFNSYNRQNDQDNSGGNYSSSWGGNGDQYEPTSGRGRGRGRGRGARFNSFDRQNDQNNFGGGVSNNASSSWGSDRNTGWGNTTNDTWNQQAAGDADKKSSWGNDKPSDDNRTSSWGGNDQNTGWGNTTSNAWNQQAAGDADKKSSWENDKPSDGNHTSSLGGDGDGWGKDKPCVGNHTSSGGGNGDKDGLSSGQGPSKGDDQNTGWGNKTGNSWSQQAAVDADKKGSWGKAEPSDGNCRSSWGGNGDCWGKDKPSDGNRTSGWGGNGDQDGNNTSGQGPSKGDDQNTGWGKKTGNSWSREPAVDADKKDSWVKDRPNDENLTSAQGESGDQAGNTSSDKGSNWGNDKNTGWGNESGKNCNQEPAGDADKKDGANEGNNMSGWGASSSNSNKDAIDAWGNPSSSRSGQSNQNSWG